MARKILEARLGKDSVRSTYRRIASVYDVWGRLTESRGRDLCLASARIKDGMSVLEVAVGTGLAFERILLANPNGWSEGVDLTADMLVQAEKKAKRTGVGGYRLAVGDAYDLEYPDNTFDVVVNNYMFDLLPEEDFDLVLAEIKRVLRPGGRLAMANMSLGERWYNELWPVVYRLNPRWVGGCRGVAMLPFLERHGFTETSRTFLSQFTFPTEVVAGTSP